jgi:hypothetical protein
MSNTPAWIMLGVLLGAVFVAALPPRRKQPPREVAVFKAAEPPPAATPRDPPQLTKIEAVFEVWGKYAVWSDYVTEVALWNEHDNAYTDFYEVRRVGDAYYFRTIPRLTRRVIARGKPIPESPLQFTETEEQYREWLSYGRSERSLERPAAPRPATTAPTLAPAPIEAPLKLEVPAMPRPEFPQGRRDERK